MRSLREKDGCSRLLSLVRFSTKTILSIIPGLGLKPSKGLGEWMLPWNQSFRQPSVQINRWSQSYIIHFLPVKCTVGLSILQSTERMLSINVLVLLWCMTSHYNQSQFKSHGFLSGSAKKYNLWRSQGLLKRILSTCKINSMW